MPKNSRPFEASGSLGPFSVDRYTSVCREEVTDYADHGQGGSYPGDLNHEVVVAGEAPAWAGTAGAGVCLKPPKALGPACSFNLKI
jgi:hypothetical protein